MANFLNFNSKNLSLLSVEDNSVITIYAQLNKIATATLSCSNLKRLYLQGNAELKRIDISNCPKLEYIGCDEHLLIYDGDRLIASAATDTKAGLFVTFDGGNYDSKKTYDDYSYKTTKKW